MMRTVYRLPPKPAKKPPFQFGLKHLLALPIGVAAFFAVAAVAGTPQAGLLLIFVLAVTGLSYDLTRSLSIAVLAFLAIICLLWFQQAITVTKRRPHPCQRNVQRLGRALLTYEAVHGMFPPAFIADEDGRPMHSWRALILPFFGPERLSERYDFSEPWDGPNNRKLADIPVSGFTCRADHEDPSTMTSYVAVIGPGTAWPEDQPTRIKDFTDGIRNTLLVVEVADSGIHWMEPRDLHVGQMAPTVNPAAGQGISSPHPGGAQVAFANGHTRFLPETTSPQDLRAMLTISGREPIDMDDATNRGAN